LISVLVIGPFLVQVVGRRLAGSEDCIQKPEF
jgi:hypothetical protein